MGRELVDVGGHEDDGDILGQASEKFHCVQNAHKRGHVNSEDDNIQRKGEGVRGDLMIGEQLVRFRDFLKLKLKVIICLRGEMLDKVSGGLW